MDGRSRTDANRDHGRYVSAETEHNYAGHLEPDSVFLRSLDAGRRLQILEQNYRNDPVSEQLLLSLYEGKTIDFLMPDKTIVQGKIIRSGFVPHATTMYGQNYYQSQAVYVQQGAGQPVIEVKGKLQFTLPGQPLFPALADDTVLKPTLSWELETDKAGKHKTTGIIFHRQGLFGWRLNSIEMKGQTP